MRRLILKSGHASASAPSALSGWAVDGPALQANRHNRASATVLVENEDAKREEKPLFSRGKRFGRPNDVTFTLAPNSVCPIKEIRCNRAGRPKVRDLQGPQN